MDNGIRLDNFTPVPPQKVKKRSRLSAAFLLSIIFVMVIGIGLVSYELFQQKPQITTAPAAGTESISCGTNYGWLIYYTFTDQNQCQTCANNRDTCLLPHVGELQKCFDNSGTVCRSIGQGDNLSTAIPACSVAQLDCVNKSFDNATASNRGSLISGFTTSNCACAQPPTSTPTTTPPITSTPTPTNTPTPTGTPTPTSTPTPTGTPPPSGTPTPTPTSSPTPTSTPTPTPAVGTLTCGTKNCNGQTNPCASGLVCINGPTSSICSLPQLTTQCQQNGTYDSCCNAGGGGNLTCGQKGCRDTTNPCQNGLTCVQSTDENYCSLSSMQSSCKINPTFNNCCVVPTTPSPTQIASTQAAKQQALQPTLPQTGETRKWYLVPAAIILFGLIF